MGCFGTTRIVIGERLPHMTGKATVIEIKPAIPAVAFQPGLQALFELSRTGSSTPSVEILSFAGQL